MAKRRFKTFCVHFFIILFGLIMLYPLLWMLSASFKTSTEIFQGTNFFPEAPTFDSYVQGWEGIMGIPFWKFFANSFTIVLFVMLGNIISCLPTAYAFSKLKFPLRSLWFTIMMGTLMLPMHVKLIPTYIVFNNLGWVNTFLPMIVPSFFATQGFFIFLMTQYMRGLPKELDEAATVDGCGPFRSFIQITVPLSVPAIVTTAIFSFLWTWNDFFTQNIYLTETKKYTVSMALRQFTDAMGNSSWGALFAMSVLSLIPLFLMFVLFQSYLVDGITAGSVKG